MKLVKASGAKGLTCLVSKLFTIRQLAEMTNYYETKSQPITRLIVWQAYWKVMANKGGAGIDKMNWGVMDKNRKSLLYKLCNRLTSGSYFPPPVKEVEIKKCNRETGFIFKVATSIVIDYIRD